MDDTQYKKQMMMIQIRRQMEYITSKQQSATSSEEKASIAQYMLMLKRKYDMIARS